ncbi:MAG TPA: GNAT family N-acetyltransferase [Dehalococcoidia bacterium]|nr:GNAT family N-acetyltransferase [Dehalococcoidia bacterium]
MQLREHTWTLQGDRIVLRPLTEGDWDILLKWNNDPEVLYFAEGDDVESRDLEQIRNIYRGISQNAFCFIIEFENTAIGECWLQEMNLECILEKYPGKDCRRIDLIIGEKRLWGQGLGTDVIRTLTRFGFEHERSDVIFGIDIGDHNPRSLKAFQKAGYRIITKIEEPSGRKAKFSYDVAITREEAV